MVNCHPKQNCGNSFPESGAKVPAFILKLLFKNIHNFKISHFKITIPTMNSYINE